MEELIEKGVTLLRMSRFGRDAGMEGLLVGGAGVAGAIGLGGRLKRAAAEGETPCEVVGFRDSRALAMPRGELRGPTIDTRPQGIQAYLLRADTVPRFATAQGSRARFPNALRPAVRTSCRELHADLASGYATLSKIVDGGAGKGKSQ